ncbi:mitochondrial carrier protein Leu5p [Trichomonascus vanleenenianus]|uniref:Mrx21p n=1 Tax=Trichomonascus vanleenenianus TaxID=2268995 RepID=UPI003ECAD304
MTTVKYEKSEVAASLEQPAHATAGGPTVSLSPYYARLAGLREFAANAIVSSFIAGGVAGAVSRTVVSPLERAKIIFQVQGAGQASYQGIGPTLVKMWKDEGWRGYMRGNGTNCIRIVPYSAVQFSSYTIFKRFILSGDPSRAELDTVERLSAGALAGITSVFATYPLDIVRTRLSILTADIGKHHARLNQVPGMWTVMKQIYRNEGGMRALYRGFIPTTMGVAPYVGLNFCVYESMRRWVTPADAKEPGPLGKLFSGAASGAIAQTLTYPFDVLRRRFQVVSMGKGELGFAYNSVLGAFRTIIRSEGVFGMYKGLTANLLKVAPSMAASWLSYEYTRELLVR